MRKRPTAVVMVSFALALLAGPAYGHASYKASDPADEEQVSAPPTSVWAEFTEPLSEGSYLRVFDPCGEQVDNGSTEISGYRMSIGMAGERAGTYTVEFRAVSAIDPHTVTGDFMFTASDGAPCPGEERERETSDDGGGAGSEAAERPTSSAEPDPEPPSGDDDGAGNRDDRAAAPATGRERSSGGETRAPERDRDRDRKVRLAVVRGTPEPEAPSIYDGIEWGAFAASLLISALIGAAGGKIYAGIMGPRA